MASGYIAHCLVPIRIFPWTSPNSNKFYIFIHGTHCPGKGKVPPSIRFFINMTFLPVTIHLISDSPEPNIIRLRMTVICPFPAIGGITFTVAIFHKICCILRTSISRIDSNIRFCSYQAAKCHKFIYSDIVWLP